MEARKITIISTKTQKKSVIMSEAETLGELKRDLTQAGIDYSDMAFYEGTAKVELLADNSALPKDVPYTNRTTGNTIITNELVFMLTNSNKKIKSGASLRQEVYTAIKQFNLQERCKKMFGKNYTQVATKDLIDVINKYGTFEESYNDTTIRTAIKALVSALYKTRTLDKETTDKILNIIENVATVIEVPAKSPYSDNELDDMFEEMFE